MAGWHSSLVKKHTGATTNKYDLRAESEKLKSIDKAATLGFALDNVKSENSRKNQLLHIRDFRPRSLKHPLICFSIYSGTVSKACLNKLQLWFIIMET